MSRRNRRYNRSILELAIEEALKRNAGIHCMKTHDIQKILQNTLVFTTRLNCDERKTGDLCEL